MFFERKLIFWHFCTLSETVPAELSELHYTSQGERFEENFSHLEFSDLSLNASSESFSELLPVKFARFSKEHSSSSVELPEEKTYYSKNFYVLFNIELSAKTTITVIKPAFLKSIGTFSRKNCFWKVYNSLIFSDFESKSFGRVLKIAKYVSRRTFRGKVVLVRNFIPFLSFSRFRRKFWNF